MVAQENTFFGQPLDALKNAANSEVTRLLKMGIKKENIKIGFISDVSDIQEGLNYTEYRHITIVSHANNARLRLSPEHVLDEDTVKDIEAVPICVNRTVRLLGCNSGKGEKPIAQLLSNQVHENIEAPNGYFIISNHNEQIIGSTQRYGYFAINAPAVLNLANQLFPNLLGSSGQFRTFSPQK